MVTTKPQDPILYHHSSSVKDTSVTEEPRIKTFFIGEMLKRQTKIEVPIDHGHDTFEAVSNTEKNLKMQVEAGISQEMFDGYPVFKGPKKGKYIVKNNKKIYINSLNPSSKSKTGFRSDLVYKVNINKD